MRPPRGPRVSARTAGIALGGLLVATLAAIAGPTLASAESDGQAETAGMNMSTMDMSTMDMTHPHGSEADSARLVGDTNGWFNGAVYTLHYTAGFFCEEPPTSETDPPCEVGAHAGALPNGTFHPLYVVVPVGFTPRHPSTLPCPRVGDCIDHPDRIDLSRVFGSGQGDALLPTHGHMLTTTAGGRAQWWNVEVIGISSQEAWQRIVRAKSYTAIQAMRAIGSADVTASMPTNLFLYFAVHDPHRNEHR